MARPGTASNGTGGVPLYSRDATATGVAVLQLSPVALLATKMPLFACMPSERVSGCVGLLLMRLLPSGKITGGLLAPRKVAAMKAMYAVPLLSNCTTG